MNQYMTENEAIESVMREARELLPNVPPLVTLGMFFLRDRLAAVHDRLIAEGNIALAAEVTDCITLTLEVSGQVEGGYNAMVEAQGRTRN